jgi:prepilin signal peptidase PulO-like enzyme (type II secretory pathway)
MGFGDVKLALLLGAMLGFAGSWPLTLAGMFLSFFFGAAGGALLMIVTGASRKSQVPFGPYLALGAMVAVVFGEPLVAFYRGLVV